MSIPDHRLLNLWSLPSEPTKVPKISDLIKLAIWGSPNHRLTLRQIYDAIEDRYPTWKQAQDKPWQRSIRHNLSLKAMFVRVERPQNEPGKGYYWALNVSNGEGNKRDRKR
ncbi:winged helix DNA-binding domain-containing protein, partial [Pholiota conissans]